MMLLLSSERIYSTLRISMYFSIIMLFNAYIMLINAEKCVSVHICKAYVQQNHSTCLHCCLKVSFGGNDLCSVPSESGLLKLFSNPLLEI